MNVKLILALGASLLAVQAQAVTVTTQTRTGTLDFGLLLGGSTVGIDFDGFNIPNQHLASVMLSFSAGASANYTVVNANIFGTTSRNITLARGLSGSLTGNGFALSDTDVVTKTQAVPRFSTRSFGNYAPQVSANGTLFSGLSAFDGAGPVSFSLFVQRSGNSLTGAPNLGLTTAVPNLLGASSNYTATLTYNSVPEPASWALLVLGFGMVGFAARRRTGAVAA